MALVETNRGSWGGNGTAWGSSTSTTKVTTSFTPSNSSLLLVVFGGLNDGGGDQDISTFTITDSVGLTWTQRIAVNTTYSGAVEAATIYWTAPVTSGAPMTITIGHSASWTFTAAAEAMLQAFDFTGYHGSSPVGVSGTATNTGDAGYTLTLSGSPASDSIVLGNVFQSNDTAGNHTASPGSGCTEEYDSASSTFGHLQTQTRTGVTTASMAWVDTTSGVTFSSNSIAAALEIKAGRPTIDSQPADTSAYNEFTAQFTVSATASSGSLTYQWQKSIDRCASYSDVSGGSGATTATYTTPSLLFSDHETFFRCNVSDALGTTPTRGAALRINPRASGAWVRN